MTGEKNRGTTVEKMWKLDDQQLSTPDHDEMVVWLLNKKNMVTILGQIKPEFVDTITVDNIGEIRCEVPIRDGKSLFIIGFWDIYLPKFVMGIEVKPYIDSFGKVLRQLNLYRAYPHNCTTILFTKDLRFKEAFESQGIIVISP